MYLSYCLNNQMIFASKKIFVNKIEEEYINRKIEEEFSLARECLHPNIGGADQWSTTSATSTTSTRST